MTRAAPAVETQPVGCATDEESLTAAKACQVPREPGARLQVQVHQARGARTCFSAFCSALEFRCICSFFLTCLRIDMRVSVMCG